MTDWYFIDELDTSMEKTMFWPRQQNSGHWMVNDHLKKHQAQKPFFKSWKGRQKCAFCLFNRKYLNCIHGIIFCLLMAGSAATNPSISQLFRYHSLFYLSSLEHNFLFPVSASYNKILDEMRKQQCIKD